MAEAQNLSPSGPPVTISLTTSSPTCSLSGSPPFTVSIEWTLSGSRPIWALISLNSGRTYGIVIRDPSRKGRRIGPPTTFIADEGVLTIEEDDEDVTLVRIGPNKPCRISYTFTTEPKVSGLRGSDTAMMKPGMPYELTLRKTCCRWMYEDEMGDGGEVERRRKLRERPLALFTPDCRAWFEAV
ncbi:hypothetical protein H2199_008686 [Coniosporium tulheliwenetii]|uniref:Uncharacterized protein n=1 Tax=Coniosporium tulheliwenetii TaxID=3383036 RepID=A0ACC2YIL4_9PEZI|nr:hypothetical protein H2199_008686 [Cladosporium sp. JES 115]